MDELPEEVLDRVAEDARGVVCRWWEDLTETQRRGLVTDWDERRETAFFAPQEGDVWEELPLVIGGRFVPAEPPLVSPEWHADYFEYLLKYPELLVNQVKEYHVGGVCTAHPEARAALKAGCIPAGFTCPFADAECPLRKLLDLAPNQSLVLTGPLVGTPKG